MSTSKPEHITCVDDIKNSAWVSEERAILLDLFDSGARVAYRGFRKLTEEPYNLYCERKRWEALYENTIGGPDLDKLLKLGREAYELGFELHKNQTKYVDVVQNLAERFRTE